jgi:hypothetical protein
MMPAGVDVRRPPAQEIEGAADGRAAGPAGREPAGDPGRQESTRQESTGQEGPSEESPSEEGTGEESPRQESPRQEGCAAAAAARPQGRGREAGLEIRPTARRTGRGNERRATGVKSSAQEAVEPRPQDSFGRGHKIPLSLGLAVAGLVAIALSRFRRG